MRSLDRVPLTEQVTEAIKHRILTRHLQAGDRLPSERELCESLTISRSILREALSVLVAQGVITKVQGKGIFVADFDRANLGVSIRLTITDKAEMAAMRDLRTILELGVLELVAQRITPDELDQLEEDLNEIERRMIQGERVNESETQLHVSLFKGAHVPALVDLYAQVVEDASNVTLYQNPELRGFLDGYLNIGNLDLFRQTLASLRRGDVCRAHEAMKQHIFTMDESLVS
jgi:GntR family transcriptional regulator, transcriptional repressor for pyruvate dehydrogenase complex